MGCCCSKKDEKESLLKSKKKEESYNSNLKEVIPSFEVQKEVKEVSPTNQVVLKKEITQEEVFTTQEIFSTEEFFRLEKYTSNKQISPVDFFTSLLTKLEDEKDLNIGMEHDEFKHIVSELVKEARIIYKVIQTYLFDLLENQEKYKQKIIFTCKNGVTGAKLIFIFPFDTQSDSVSKGMFEIFEKLICVETRLANIGAVIVEDYPTLIEEFMGIPFFLSTSFSMK